MLRTNREAAFKNKKRTKERQLQNVEMYMLVFSFIIIITIIIVHLKVNDEWRRGVACTTTRDTNL